jgi:hypothetical protein
MATTTHGLRKRFWIEAGLATATGILFIMTLISREWIEVVFGVEPDGGNGELEWLVSFAFLVATITFAVVARGEYKKRSVGASYAGKS